MAAPTLITVAPTGAETAKSVVPQLPTTLEELVETAQRGGTEEERTEALRTMMVVFNELLPRVPIWGYTYLSPAVEGVRVESFAEDHPADQNEQYQDNHVILQLIQGDLRPVQD